MVADYVVRNITAYYVFLNPLPGTGNFQIVIAAAYPASTGYGPHFTQVLTLTGPASDRLPDAANQ